MKSFTLAPRQSMPIAAGQSQIVGDLFDQFPNPGGPFPLPNEVTGNPDDPSAEEIDFLQRYLYT